jgi:hypothetical protein
VRGRCRAPCERHGPGGRTLTVANAQAEREKTLAARLYRASDPELIAARMRARKLAYALSHNARSRRVMEKLGLTCEREFTHEDRTHVLYRVTAAQARTTTVTIS